MVQSQLSFWDSLLDRSLSPATTAMTVDLNPKADFLDVNGDSCMPPVLAPLGRKLGYGCIFLT